MTRRGALFHVGALPAEALAASARFYAQALPELLAELADEAHCMTLVFDPADHTHAGWRLALVQQLARRYAPLRINAIASDDKAAIAAAAEFVAEADGLTGQLLALDGNGADKVLYNDV